MVNPSLVLYRIGNFFVRYRLRIIGDVLTWTNRLLFGGIIPSTASIGKRVQLGYWGLGIVIHSKAVIGDDCWILQNVTIGRKAGVDRPPRLGRNVAVGAGAVIIGDIDIGENSVIGANSVVTKSVPPNTVFAGVPARFIKEIPMGSVSSHYKAR